MRLKNILIAAAVFLALSGRAMALTCAIEASGPDGALSNGSTVLEGSTIDAAIDCSSLDAPDAQLFVGWAPPMPFHSASGSVVMPPFGTDIGPVGVLEIGNCCDPTLGTCPMPASGKRCDPFEPGCGPSDIAVLNLRKHRDMRDYKGFKRILVKAGKSGGDVICQTLANIQVGALLIHSARECDPNCMSLPMQSDEGNPTNAPGECTGEGNGVDPSPGGGLSGGGFGGGSGGGSQPPKPICPYTNQPVTVATGAMWHQQTDFSVAGRTAKTALTLTRTYTSNPAQYFTLFGSHWQSNYDMHLEAVPGSQNFTFIDENGGANLYTSQGNGTFSAPAGQYNVLTQFSDHFELKTADSAVYTFGSTAGTTPGKILKVTEVHGESVQFSYDLNGILQTISSPFAGSLTFTHNNLGHVTSISRDRDHLSYFYAYDSKNRLQSVTDYRGRKYSFAYIDDKQTLATNGLLASITDPIGRVTGFTYDEKGRANFQYEPGGGVWSFTYGTQQTTVKQPNGSTTIYQIDSHQHISRQVMPDNSLRYNDWSSGTIQAQRNEFGGSTKWTFDAKGNITSSQRPEDAAATNFTFDPKFNKATAIQPTLGAATQVSLDPNTGDVTKQVRGNLTVQFTYDAFGNILSTNNGKATFSDQRDANGLLTYQFDLHNPQTLSYDSRGRVTARTYQSGRVLTYAYNDDDQVLLATDSAGPTTANTYDLMGRLVKTVVSAGGVSQVTTTVFDDRDRVVSTTDAMGRTTTNTFDLIAVREQPISTTDPAGRTTRFEYDGMDRLIKITNPLGAITKYTHDSQGNLTSVTDANGNVTRYSYDRNQRKLSEVRPSVAGQSAATLTHNFFYDSADHVVREEFNGKRFVDYKYDSLDRMISKTIGVGTSVDDISIFSYEDIAGQILMKSASNGVSNIGFTNELSPPYSLMGFQLLAAQMGNPLGLIEGNFAIARDVNGELASVSKDGVEVFSKTYDPAGRLLTATSGSFTSTLGYDGFGRKSSVSHTDGAQGGFQYDLLNRLTQVTWTGPTPISESLGWDLAGNITSLQRENGVASQIAYNAADELVSSTGAESRIYTLDLLGNRLGDSLNGNGSFVSNFLTGNGVASYLADPDGFGDTIRETSAASMKNYGFRADDRLNALQVGSTQAAYYFDALGRRVAKVINEGGQSFAESFVHLGGEDRILMAKAGDGTITTYIDGQGVDEHLAEVKRGVGKGYVTDHLSSVLNGDAAGASHRFSFFGAPTVGAVLSASSSPVMYGFTGREYEPESGLNYHRKREYNPFAGTWLGQDAHGIGDRELNLYAYSMNNPLRFLDGTGFSPQDPTTEELSDIQQRLRDSVEALRRCSVRRNCNPATVAVALSRAKEALTYNVGADDTYNLTDMAAEINTIAGLPGITACGIGAGSGRAGPNY